MASPSGAVDDLSDDDIGMRCRRRRHELTCSCGAYIVVFGAAVVSPVVVVSVAVAVSAAVTASVPEAVSVDVAASSPVVAVEEVVVEPQPISAVAVRRRDA